MSWTTKIRRGQGPFWGSLKQIARGVRSFHIPVAGPTRMLFGLLYRFHVVARESLIWAARFFWFEPLFRSQCESVGDGLYMEKLPYIQGVGRILIGRGVRLSGQPQISFGRSGVQTPELIIGDGTFIGHHCGFNVGRSIHVGRNCLFATGVLVYDQDGHPLDAQLRRAQQPTPIEAIEPVVFGDDVWVGAGAVILKGVRIGERAVIAARAVVTKDVPADAVVAGNPARVIRRLDAPGADFESDRPDTMAPAKE
jgi:acetyltransferase-like isoleucine patch superfamily enzyme